MMKKTIILCIGAVFALTLQAQTELKQQGDTAATDAAARLAQTETRLAQAEERIGQLETKLNKGKLLQMPKHEVSLSVGIPGLAMPEHHDENVSHLLDFEDFSAVGKLTYFYNFNKHWAIGGSASYWHAHDGCDVYTDTYNPLFDFNPSLPIPHNDANFNVVSLMPEARAFWFQRRHFGMYSRLGIGVSFVHLTQHLDGTYKHLYIDPVFELAPIGFDFGGKHLRGKLELGNIGQSFLINVGIGYRF